MRLSPFVNCCGAEILHELFLTDNFIKEVKYCLEEAKAHRVGIVLAITNLQQIQQGKLLKKCGFRKLKTFPNPNNGLMTLTLWGYDVNNPIHKIGAALLYPIIRVFSFIDRLRERRHA